MTAAIVSTADLSRTSIAIAKRRREQHWFLERILNYSYDKGMSVWLPGSLYWFTRCTYTFDKHWQKKGLGSPYNRMQMKPYLPFLFHYLQTEPILFIPKSREMVVTWSLLAYLAWKCQFFAETQVVFQGQKLEKVQDLIIGRDTPGYARTLWERQDGWLKAAHPLAKRIEDMPAHRISWKNGSEIIGVPAGADQVRSYHPSIVVVDEAAHVDDFQGSYDAAVPVAQQIIAVSSAAPSWFGDICQR